MNETVRLLQDVVRNARTGEAAAEHLLDKVSDPGMRGELSVERERYRDAAREAEQALTASGGQPEPQGIASRAGMWLGTELNALMDTSNAHIAEMVIQGATMGVIEMTKARNSCPEADSRAAGIASRFIVMQNDIIDRQKAYLAEPVRT